MKVIFLDNDGVICLSSNWGTRHKKQKKWGNRKLSMSTKSIPVEYRFDNFDKKAIQILNEILVGTDAEIVVSSDWRQHATLEELGEYYESQGILKKPIAFTPNLSECNNYDDTFPWMRQWDLEQTRSLEIKQYLLNHPEVTHWVAVDDLNMGKDEPWKDVWGLENFVLTPRGREGIKQSGIKDKILNYLDNGSNHS
jgi:hypothetical protein